MKTRVKVFHAAAILASSLINMHVFVSIAAHAHVLYTIAFGLSLWYVSRFADVKIGAIKEIFRDSKDKPDTQVITKDLRLALPDQTVTVNQVHAGNFWDCYPWADFATQDSDGDIYIWEKEPQKDEDSVLPQWVLPYQPTAVNSFDYFKFDYFKTAPANNSEPNWTNRIAKRGEMPEWLKKALP